MTQLFSKASPTPAPAGSTPVMPTPLPPALQQSPGAKPGKSAQVPSLLGLAGAGASGNTTQGKSLLGS